jgi:hypothetical protein
MSTSIKCVFLLEFLLEIFRSRWTICHKFDFASLKKEEEHFKMTEIRFFEKFFFSFEVFSFRSFRNSNVTFSFSWPVDEEPTHRYSTF